VTHRVDFSETAWQDADEIYRWIADRADPQTAQHYVDRIIDYCSGLRNFPNRGTPRADLAPGMRTTVFEGRAVIVYVVQGNAVRILRILHKGRDLGRALQQ
jgi:toxin ParE1/3/4